MRTLLVGCAVLLASSASAHIYLDAPGSFQVQDLYGSPQKTEPCGGAGTATGTVTTVMAGSQLVVTWRETIIHPGHFRIGIARQASDFTTPIPVLNNGGANCASAPTQSTASYPILVDGLYQHTGPAPNNTYSTTITVPMMSCDNCVLQLMQFMSAHAPPCFYYQCATLRIQMPDAGTGTGGGGGSTGGGGGATGGGAASGGGGGATGGGSSSGGGGATGGGTGGGTAPQVCNASNCQGCCGADGTCFAGNRDSQCGGQGQLCVACTADTECNAAQCTPPRGCGCSEGALGALLLVPLAWFFRRRGPKR